MRYSKISQIYNFYNDIYAGLEPEYDDKVKQYDLVPLQCGALSAANNRLITADVTENYEVDCFDFKVEVEYHPEEEIQRFDGKITCWIDIKVNSGCNSILYACYANDRKCRYILFWIW